MANHVPRSWPELFFRTTKHSIVDRVNSGETWIIMRSPSLARLQSRAVSGLTRSARFQPQTLLRQRCASTAAFRSAAVAPAYQSKLGQWDQRRNASATASAMYVCTLGCSVSFSNLVIVSRLRRRTPVVCLKPPLSTTLIRSRPLVWTSVVTLVLRYEFSQSSSIFEKSCLTKYLYAGPYRQR
jgi:hypothetical protein